MLNFLMEFKRDYIGYVALILLALLIFGTHLIVLFIFLLFIYLLTDIIVNDVQKWLRVIPANVLFWMLYIVLIGFFVFFSIRIVPLLFSDVPHYFDLIWKDAGVLTDKLSQKYDVTINLNMLRGKFLTEVSRSVGHVIQVFNDVTKSIIYFIFALVLNFLIYQERKEISAVFLRSKGSLLSYLYEFILIRIKRFYMYFRQVMGGQVIISLINVLITAIAISFFHLPHQISLLCLVFFFGLLPVVGNLISNTILTITALVSAGIIPAFLCLGLLIGIHKFEYFLNSKIVGSIIQFPMFITLISLLLGEALLGFWGIIIAMPLILTIRDELELKKMTHE